MICKFRISEITLHIHLIYFVCYSTYNLPAGHILSLALDAVKLYKIQSISLRAVWKYSKIAVNLLFPGEKKNNLI